MRLLCCGVSFHDTPLEEREPMVFTETQQRQLMRAMFQARHIHEGFAVCTCNRTELYLYTEAAVDAVAFADTLIAELSPTAKEAWRTHRYVHEGLAAIEHLFRVASGLDSQMLGENQILRQVKDAYSMSVEEGTSRFFLHRLLHSAFRAAKSVRTETDINAGAVSISAAAVELAAAQVNLSGASVVLVGAGENAALAAVHLAKHGVGQLDVVNRSLEKAAALCDRLEMGHPHTFEVLLERVGQADLIFCSTASETPIMTAEHYAYLLSQRTRPLVIIDIAVPRDVDPQLGQLETVRLFNIDDLEGQVRDNLQRRSAQIPEANRLIIEHVNRYSQWLDSLNIKDVVSDLVNDYTRLAAAEAQRYGGQFRADDRERLEHFAVTLVKKVLHGPIQYLKRSEEEELVWDQLQAVELVRKMLLNGERKGRS